MTGSRSKLGDWRLQRKAGITAIAGSMLIGGAAWLAITYWGPTPAGAGDLAGRMLLALKCWIVAVLFCLVAGINAVAHERLQTAAFDPLAGHETERLRVNQRYLQNTLEQSVVLAAALFGLAAHAETDVGARAVVATTVVWIAGRFAFWLGYHRSAAMRGLGAPGVAITLILLLYLAWRIGYDIAGTAGAAGLVGAYLLLEVVLFRTTRSAD